MRGATQRLPLARSASWTSSSPPGAKIQSAQPGGCIVRSHLSLATPLRCDIPQRIKSAEPAGSRGKERIYRFGLSATVGSGKLAVTVLDCRFIWWQEGVAFEHAWQTGRCSPVPQARYWPAPARQSGCLPLVRCLRRWPGERSTLERPYSSRRYRYSDQPPRPRPLG